MTKVWDRVSLGASKLSASCRAMSGANLHLKWVTVGCVFGAIKDSVNRLGDQRNWQILPEPNYHGRQVLIRHVVRLGRLRVCIQGFGEYVEALTRFFRRKV